MPDNQQKNMPLWTVVLLGGLGIPYFIWGGLSGGLPVGQRAGSQSLPEERVSSLRAQSLAHLQPLSDLWRISAGGNNSLEPRELKDGLAKHANVYSLIVCLPDPLDTSVTHQFDQIVEAVQRAVERQHFVLDRYYFPWEERRSNTHDKVPQPRYPEDKKTTNHIEAENKSLPTHSHYPGMLLFRSTRPPQKPAQLPDILCVFLVPETATWGIDKIAFATCLDFICFDMPQGSETTVYCVGPYFSGSQSSFQYTIRMWAKVRDVPLYGATTIIGLLGSPGGQEALLAACALFPGRAEPRCGARLVLSIISGSASAIKPSQFENQIQGTINNCVCTFRTTVHSDDAIARAITNYIRDYRRPIRGLPRVSLLAESNTEFGEHVRTVLGSKKEELVVKTYAFPLNISDLRYDQLKQAQYAEPGSPVKSLFSSRRSVLYENEGGRDTEPSFAPSTDGVLRERIVDQILTEVAKDRAQFVGVAATDVKDTLFLMERVRRRCPDALLFTTWADQLFLDPDMAPFMRGVVVASTYPLNSWTQEVTFPFPKADKLRVHFSDHTCQGYYNATTLQLDAMLDKESGVPNCDTSKPSALNLLDYGLPLEWGSADVPGLCKRIPPVWISVVGQRAFYPLKAYQNKDLQTPGEGTVSGSPEAQEVECLARGRAASGDMASSEDVNDGLLSRGRSVWVLFYVLVSGLSLVLVYYSFTALTTKKLRVIDDFKVPDESELHVSFYGLMLLGFLILALIHGFLAKAVWIPFDASGVHSFIQSWLPPISWLIVEAGIVSVLLLLITSNIKLAKARSTRTRRVLVAAAGIVSVLPLPITGIIRWVKRQSTTTRSLLILGLSLAVMCLVGFGLWRLTWYPDRLRADDWLYVERATALTSGVSPFLPIFFLGASWWCWVYYRLHRVRLRDKTVKEDPFDEDKAGQTPTAFEQRVEKYIASVKAADAKVRRFIESPWNAGVRNKTGIIGIATFVVVVGAFVIPRHLWTGEGLAFDVLCALLFYFVWLMFIADAAAFVSLLNAVMELMHEIALLPIVQAYSRLPTSVGRLFGRYLASSRSRTSDWAVARKQLWAIRSFHNRFERLFESERVEINFPDKLQRLWKKCEELINDPKNQQTTPYAIDFGIVRPALHVLGPVWIVKPASEGSGNADANTAPHTVSGNADANRAPHTVPADVDWVRRVPEIKEGNEAQMKEFRSFVADLEDLVGIQLVRYVSHYFLYLRSAIVYLVVTSLILFLVVSSYPFQPQGLLVMLTLVMMGVIAGLVISFFVRLERNEILSCLANTRPNKVTWDSTFLGGILSSAGPLVLVLATQLGGFSDMVRTLLEPVLRAFGG